MEIHEKFCNKVNKKSIWFGDANSNLTNNSKFLKNIKENVVVKDLKLDKIKEFNDNSKLKVCWVTKFYSNAYLLDKIIEEEEDALTTRELKNYLSNKGNSLPGLEGGYDDDADDIILIGEKLKKQDIPNLYLSDLSVTLYEDVTDWFIDFIKSDRNNYFKYKNMMGSEDGDKIDLEILYNEFGLEEEFFWEFVSGGIGIGKFIGYTIKEGENSLQSAIASMGELNYSSNYRDRQSCCIKFYIEEE